MGIKARLAAAATAVVMGLSLTGTFNAQAAETKPPHETTLAAEDAKHTPDPSLTPYPQYTQSAGAQTVPANDVTATPPQAEEEAPATPSLSPLTMEMKNAFDAMEQHVQKELSNPDRTHVLRYQPEQDPFVVAQIAEIKRLLDAGADANAIDPDSGATFLGKAIFAAYSTLDPDLVKAFIDAGADPRQADGRGWNGVDHAINVLMQSQNTRERGIIAAIDIYKNLREAGVTFRDNNRFFRLRFAQNYIALARNSVALNALREEGLITDQQFNDMVFGNLKRLRDISKDIEELDEDFFTKYGATIAHYPDVFPGGPEPYTAQDGDTLESLANRFMNIMDASSVDEAKARIAAENGITINPDGSLSKDIEKGDRLLLPVSPEYFLNTFYLPPRQTLQTLAPYQTRLFFKDGASEEDVLREIARLNGLNEEDVLSGNFTGERGKAYIFPFRNTIHHESPNLTPPASYDEDSNSDAYLVVIETQSDHGKRTLRAAMGIGYGINPDVTPDRFFALDELLLNFPRAQANSDALKMLLDLEESGLSGRVIFSHSMALNNERLDEEGQNNMRDGRYRDSVAFESINQFLEHVNRIAPIVFNAAGNWFPKDGDYVQSHLTMHSPRSINVGAVGEYPGITGSDTQLIISPYSNAGADVCMVLPERFRNVQMEGTSFATPSLASVTRQFVEWYGNELTFEEVMAVGLMTANRDILDMQFDTAGQPRNDLSKSGPHFARYQANGAGLPFNERCGAGVIDVEAWDAQLKKMVELKNTLSNPEDDLISEIVRVGSPSEIITDANGDVQEYVYRIPITEDMTIGKLTFMTPQAQGYHDDVTVRMPSGFETVLLDSPNDVLSTSAFSYEDVQKGQYIELRSKYEITDQGGMILRGHKDGNAIQLIRDHLRSQDILPSPLSNLAGNTELVDGQLAPEYRTNLPSPQGFNPSNLLKMPSMQ